MPPIQNFDDLPLLDSFKGLKLGDPVYSRRYGLGSVTATYKNEIIVAFDGARKRFSVEDKELRLIPEDLKVKKKVRIEVYKEGEKISFRKFKKEHQDKMAIEKQESVALTEAADVLGLSKNTLIKELIRRKIEIKMFGRSKTINRNDLFALSKELILK